jgi:hypothetical protein
MSFLRHREIYPSDGGKTLTGRAPAHRLDEFPTGYSLAGCSPAEPASASPASLILLRLQSFVYDVSANGNLSLILVSHHRGAAQKPGGNPEGNRGRETGDRRNVSALSALAESEGLLPGVDL